MGAGPKVSILATGMEIKAVTFDVGGTLIEPWPSVGHVYAEVAARHGVRNVSADTLNERFQTAWGSRKPFEHSRAGWEELVDEVFLGHCDPPSRSFFPELYDRFSQPDVWRVFTDVVPALEALGSRGMKLGVISNWDERLRGLLRALKLDRYFETFAISFEIGFPKPSRVIFEQAAVKLSLPANAILHIGDSLEMDVVGAQAAGFQALRINRSVSNSDVQTMVSLAELLLRIKAFWER
jgi:putative hydrolase of the HAD superfamily